MSVVSRHLPSCCLKFTDLHLTLRQTRGVRSDCDRTGVFHYRQQILMSAAESCDPRMDVDCTLSHRRENTIFLFQTLRKVSKTTVSWPISSDSLLLHELLHWPSKIFSHSLIIAQFPLQEIALLEINFSTVDSVKRRRRDVSVTISLTDNHPVFVFLKVVYTHRRDSLFFNIVPIFSFSSFPPVTV